MTRFNRLANCPPVPNSGGVRGGFILIAMLLTIVPQARADVDFSSTDLVDQLILFEKTFNERRPRGEGGRRGGLCAVSPGSDRLQKNYTIWNDRPLFVWQADGEMVVHRLRVFQVDTEELMGEQSLTETDQSARYSGKPLQPGKVYSWELQFSRKGRSDQPTVLKTPVLETMNHNFQVMDNPKRKQIDMDLDLLRINLETVKANSETIVIHNAQHFVNEGLLSDALQVLYEADRPSPRITNMLNTLLKGVCSS
jgi:hypothetical protein